MNDKDTLTNSERAQLRNYLLAHMGDHPARVPLGIRLLDWVDGLFGASHKRAFFSPARLASASLIVMIFAGAGTSYAARGSLPGDALYAVKVHVNEKLEGVIATSPTSRAQFDAELATRRLEEAEILAAANKLTPEASIEIQARINEAAASFNNNVAAIAVTEESPTALEDAHSELEASLSAHANVLAVLSEVGPETKIALAPIISIVESHVAFAREARNQIGAAAQLAAIAGSSTREASAHAQIATQKKETARRALGTVQSLASEITSSEKASSSHSIETTAQKVEQVVAVGDEYLENGEYDKALNAFQTAIRAASQVETEAALNTELQKIFPTLPLEATTSATTAIEDDVDQVIHIEAKKNEEGRSVNVEISL